MSAELFGSGSRHLITLGRYAVLGHVATDGKGAVYKARDTRLGRIVALRVLPPALAAQPGALERLRRAARLRHRNIAALYECGEQRGVHYLVTEFTGGIDLHEYVGRKGRLDPGEACGILLQAAAALECAAEEGVVHRDVNPSSIFLTQRDGRRVVKVANFGLSGGERAEGFRVTRGGSTVSSLDYTAPEQARDGGSADVRGDIYSLGCTFYHLLAGRPPFPEGNLAERQRQHAEDQPPDVRRLNPDVDGRLLAVLDRMLAKRPEDRYQTPAELIEALEALAAGESPGGSEPTPVLPTTGAAPPAEEVGPQGEETEPGHALPWRWLLVGTAALVLAVSGLAVLLTQPPRDPPPHAGPVADPGPGK
ncbi:MAG TPA: serine/threonine-protein kinase [Gemmataceae bacterium]|nr:serine/threonine-protein kinase [Gemmataceae bacterium]